MASSRNSIFKIASDMCCYLCPGNPISILDGVFVAIKDDNIDCFPYPTKGATTFFDQIHTVEKDAVCVARLRKCGVIFIGKANMHELGLGVTENNPNYGTARHPHSVDRYTGGSSSGPAALVSSGLCSVAIGTYSGGSVRIPSALCGIVGFKTTYGRTDMTGVLCDSGTVEVASPLVSSVEDAILVYSAIAGSRPMEKLTLRPIEEITLPELEEMRTAHVVSIGSESFCDLNLHYKAGRRIMHYHMEAFKKVDVIATPTTGVLPATGCPTTPPSPLQGHHRRHWTSTTSPPRRLQHRSTSVYAGAATTPVTMYQRVTHTKELCLKKRKRPSAFYDILKA
ncbi:fatty acid amide hydrolase-like isoform X6 [Miscanthus floridulus]|uniref:fatty acid amide hydrolase-like isoform X6 n=1 Tax=Miscanthus floridulus TaxID=154761 RepID=UPI003459D858